MCLQDPSSVLIADQCASNLPTTTLDEEAGPTSTTSNSTHGQKVSHISSSVSCSIKPPLKVLFSDLQVPLLQPISDPLMLLCRWNRWTLALETPPSTPPPQTLETPSLTPPQPLETSPLTPAPQTLLSILNRYHLYTPTCISHMKLT